jgi:hypothetical protein
MTSLLPFSATFALMLEGYSEVSNLEPVRPKIEYHEQ